MKVYFSKECSHGNCPHCGKSLGPPGSIHKCGPISKCS